jgi:hypothetical protein
MSRITIQQVQHFSRRLSQQFFIPQIAIIGGYHGINVGDLALGYAIKNILYQRNISCGLQTIYNLEKWFWPVAEKAIIGGGAVGYNSLVEVIAKRYQDYPGNVAFLGVDFNDQYYSDRSIDFLKNVRWISCRSKDQVIKLESLTGRKDIFSHPDIAFSLPLQSVLSKESSRLEKKLLLNVVPLYGKIENDKIVPLTQYASERPELYQNWDQIQSGYHEFVRIVVDQYLSEGYIVENLPFTPMDKAAAGIMLKGLKVYHHSYYPDPLKIIDIVRNSHSFFATRYHATIFGLKANLNVIPFAYAKKNEQLLRDLTIPEASYFKPLDFSKGYSPGDRIESVIYDHNRVRQLQSAANQMINDCINQLLYDK